jgi:hypothetical protein
MQFRTHHAISAVPLTHVVNQTVVDQTGQQPELQEMASAIIQNLPEYSLAITRPRL